MPAARRDRVPGIHAIVGAESWLADQALEALLVREGLAGGDAVQVLRGDEASFSRVIDAARMGSLFAQRRAVVVRAAELLKGEGDELEAYLASPNPDVVLVFMAGRPDKRRVAWKRLLDAAEVVSAEPPRGRALRGYIADQLRRRQLALDEQAFEELMEHVGQDLRRLMGELDKLEAFSAGRRERLTAEDVASVVGRGLAQPLYRLGDSFTGRRPAQALGLMEDVLEEGEPPLKVLATMHYALRRLRAAQALAAERLPREALASRLGVPPFKVQDLMDDARRWKPSDLEAAVRALERADRRVKTGAEPRVALAAAVVEACGAGVREPRPARTAR